MSRLQVGREAIPRLCLEASCCRQLWKTARVKGWRARMRTASARRGAKADEWECSRAARFGLLSAGPKMVAVESRKDRCGKAGRVPRGPRGICKDTTRRRYQGYERQIAKPRKSDFRGGGQCCIVIEWIDSRDQLAAASAHLKIPDRGVQSCNGSSGDDFAVNRPFMGVRCKLETKEMRRSIQRSGSPKLSWPDLGLRHVLLSKAPCTMYST